MKTAGHTTIPSEGLNEPGEERVVEIKDLCISFGGHEVLNGMNLALRKGENLAVLGKSGSGKSVLIKCLVRLLEADSGTLIMFGRDMLTLKRKELNEVRRRTGFLFQGAALYDSMSVRENLEFPLRNAKKVQKERLDERVEEALENVGLLHAINKMPSELSGGMRKRVGLARTLILKPEIILYDEPTTGLDPATSAEISELILEVQAKYRASGIIITHDMDCARTTANRAMIIRNGRSYAEGSLAEIEGSEDPWIRSFFHKKIKS